MIKIIKNNDTDMVYLLKNEGRKYFYRFSSPKLKYKKCTHMNTFNFKYIFFLIILFIFIQIYNNKIKKINNVKVCLCAIGKNENKYVREYVEHYKKYGVDKIIIYDNNDLNGEYFENILLDYIKKKYVKIINYRGKKTMQVSMMRDCYKNNYNIYDWFIMYDMDEFIFLKNFNNIKYYLNNKKFDKCKLIQLNRAVHTDNDQIYYKNKTLFERFPKAFYNIVNVKSILKGHNPDIEIKSIHKINDKIKGCNGFGQKTFQNKTDFKYYYINHYYFKSTEEFINKINRGDAYYLTNKHLKYKKIKFYFAFNRMTLEKINFIENRTGIILTKFRNSIIKKNKFK